MNAPESHRRKCLKIFGKDVLSSISMPSPCYLGSIAASTKFRGSATWIILAFVVVVVVEFIP
jgi:hypothetical protein